MPLTHTHALLSAIVAAAGQQGTACTQQARRGRESALTQGRGGVKALAGMAREISLNAAAAARRPVTRDTHMSDHALIIDDPHVSDESLMTHRQREVLPARGTWEWYGPAPLRPSSQLSPWLHCHPAVRRAARCAWAVSLARCNRDQHHRRGVDSLLRLPSPRVVSSHAPHLSPGADEGEHCAEGQPGASPAVARPIAPNPPRRPQQLGWSGPKPPAAFA